MLTPLPFALQASAACVPHAELALSLAAAFHEVDAAAVDTHIERIGAHLVLPPEASPLEELVALGDLFADTLVAPRADVGGDVCGLMLDDALDQGEAHPLIRAVVAVEVGRRHGLDFGLVSDGRQVCIAHEQLADPLLLCAETNEIVDARKLSADLQWHCSHETCGLLLDELEERWVAWTRFDDALLAADLRLRLPLDEDSAAAARTRLERVRARLN